MPRLRRRVRHTALAFALLASNAIAADRHLHTYAMQRALPEQVLPALQPLLSEGSSAQVFGNQLILNVTDAEFESAQALLRQIDVAARSLLISVRKRSDSRSDRAEYGIDGRIGDVRAGSSRSSSPTLHGNQTTRTGNRDGTQSVRAVEGMPAFISTGTSQLVTTRQSPYGSTRELVPVESGFYATARVIASDVVIEIDQRDDRTEGRAIRTQGIETQVRGRVGEWIPIGSLDAAQRDHHGSWTSSASAARTDSGDIALKVEVAP